jgi:hypothetical protein
LPEALQMCPRNLKPYGLSYDQWCIKWWRWLLSIPKFESPVIDLTGINAELNQNDPCVFFLCQTFESSDIVPIRNITIPRGRSLFMPLINWISTVPDDGRTDEDLVTKANKKMSAIQDVQVIINGKEINLSDTGYRVIAGPFEVTLPDANILNLDPGPTRVYSDGYWIFSEPLYSSISLSTYGSCSLGLTKIGVLYNIKVEQ